MKQRNQYTLWNEKEDAELIQLTEKYTERNGKINWDKVSSHFPHRTRVQIKAHFTNNLKTKPTYQKWTVEECQMMIVAVQNHGKDWDVIKEKYFPTRTKGQLYIKYKAIMDERTKQIDIMKKLHNHQIDEVQKLPVDQLESTKTKIQLMSNRLKVRDGQPLNMPSDWDKHVGVDKINPAELVLLKSYDGFDMEQLKQDLEEILKHRTDLE